MIQTDEAGYLVSCKRNLRTDEDSDIIKDINKGKGEKQVELKLWIKDLLTLKKNREVYYSYCDININIVDIYGVIVSVQHNRFGVLYKVDDGTGEIDCWRDNRSEINTEKLSKILETSEHSFDNEIHPSESPGQSSTFYQDTEVFFKSFNCEKEPEVVQWLKDQILEQIQENSPYLGDTVHLRGKLSDFRGERCIRIYNIRHVKDINEEIDRRLELIHLYETVYSKKKLDQNKF